MNGPEAKRWVYGQGPVSTDPTRPAVLLASDDGRDIYRQLGFLDLVRFTIWEHQPAKP